MNRSSIRKFGAIAIAAGFALAGAQARADTFNPIASAPLPDGSIAEQYTFTLDAGNPTGWHYHQGNVWVVVISGTLTEDHGCGQPLDVHNAGTAFAEVPGVVHNVTNTGNDTAVIAVSGVGPGCTADFNDLVPLEGPVCNHPGNKPKRIKGPYCP
ncbi:MAG TPA: cupin domain-containing protein [Candidatus Acidoferrales bacterium]|nr:cupin domain-containing protein [Candidatus Acidoferrales bacterium]